MSSQALQAAAVRVRWDALRGRAALTGRPSLLYLDPLVDDRPQNVKVAATVSSLAPSVSGIWKCSYSNRTPSGP